MHNEPSPFIAGIYNYCDGWCERCRFTDRCRVYDQQQQSMERHLLRGEDPDDPEVWMGDMMDSLDASVQMLQQIAEEAEVDLEEIEADPPPLPSRQPQDDAFYQRTERWSERVGLLLKRIEADMPGVGADLAGTAAALSDREQEEVIGALEGTRDAFELLSRYQFLIPVKLARALGSLSESAGGASPELARHDRYEALGTAKLVHECLGKAGAALWQVAEFGRQWQDEALPLAAEAEALRQAIDATFPGHQRFIRPGLDEYPP